MRLKKLMTYTKLSPEEIRSAIYAEAKQQFLTHGIARTEMKRLATVVGIGRTTLYRYFPSIDCLAFLVACECLDAITEPTLQEDEMRSLNGYASAVWHVDRLIDDLILHREVLTFFLEFDMRYAPGYPEIPEALQYRERLRRLYAFQSALICKGQMDGSIRKGIDTYAMLSGIGHSLFGFAQRTTGHPLTSEQRRDTMRWIAHSLIDTLRP